MCGHVVRSNWMAVIVRYFYRLFFFPSFTLAHNPEPVVPPTIVSGRLLHSLSLSLSLSSYVLFLFRV